MFGLLIALGALLFTFGTFLVLSVVAITFFIHGVDHTSPFELFMALVFTIVAWGAWQLTKYFVKNK